MWGAGRVVGCWGASRTRPRCAHPTASSVVYWFTRRGPLAEAVQPVAHALGAKQLVDLVGRQRGRLLLVEPVRGGAREQGEAEEELVGGEERGGDVAGRLGEGDLQLLAAAQRLQQGAEVAGGVEGLGSDALEGAVLARGLVEDLVALGVVEQQRRQRRLTRGEEPQLRAQLRRGVA